MILSEEQELLRSTANSFVAEHCDINELRMLRDERRAPGFNAKLWIEMAALGWAGIAFPEPCGGAGLGFAELGVVLEALGRRLTVSPFLSTVLLGAPTILEGGNSAQQQEILPAVCEGRALLALASQETARHEPHWVETSARRDGSSFVLNGTKKLVVDGAAADWLVVLARTGGAAGERAGLTLFLLDPKTPGVTRKRTFLIDSRSAANIEFADVKVCAEQVLGEVDHGADILDPVLDRAAVALSAEMLGGIQEIFDRTIAYLKEREQFGVKIGSFQGLQHRAARWFCEVELTRSIVWKALHALDENSPDAPALASACKARASDVFRLSSEEGIQMHGGIGVTDEADIGFFVKRSRVSELLLGDAAFHRSRFAVMQSS